MNIANSTLNNILSSLVNGIAISISTRFWLYLIPNILSILGSLFVLYHILFNRKLRKALHNHVIILLLFIGLIYECIDVPLMLHYFTFSNTWKLSIVFSRLWTFIDYLCYSIQLIGFAWASVERHILIFHSRWISRKKNRFFVHYLPLIAIMVYCFIYYFTFILFPFCGDLNYPSPFNGVPIGCILFNPIVALYDAICHQVIPTLTILIASPALLIRVLWHKNRLNRSIEWRKQRKMTVQLLSISILYFIFMGPRTIVEACVYMNLISYNMLVFFYYSAFFANYIIFLFPFVCCGSMPEIGKKLMKIFFCQHQQGAVAPMTVSREPLANRWAN